MFWRGDDACHGLGPSARYRRWACGYRLHDIVEETVCLVHKTAFRTYLGGALRVAFLFFGATAWKEL
jgi:hypothetical protein